MGQFRCREAAGFTMLEALVAIVVLAFGVLGVANLLVKSFRFAQQSSYDIVALQIANDMADRMRANDALTRAGAYDKFDTSNGAPAIADNANPYVTPCTGDAKTCAPLTAAFDQAEWARMIAANLPKGRAVVCRDATAFNLDTGYDWGCAMGPGGATATPLVVKIGWVSRFADTGGTDVPAGSKLADSRDAKGDAKPQIVVTILPGVEQ